MNIQKIWITIKKIWDYYLTYGTIFIILMSILLAGIYCIQFLISLSSNDWLSILIIAIGGPILLLYLVFSNPLWWLVGIGISISQKQGKCNHRNENPWL
jgi:hypothetical protein